MAANCPPVVEYCGSTWSVNCDGTIDVDLAKDVYRYKVFIFRPSGNNTFVDLYNNEDPLDNFFTAPFNSGIFGQIQPGDNAFVEVYSPCQDNSNGGFIINFSELLACYCSEYSSFLMDQATNPFVVNDGSGLSQQDKLYSSSNLKDVNLYPNPATSEINIDLPLIDTEYRINIVDVNGKVVKSFKNNGGSTIMNAQGLTTGIYFVHIQNDDLTHVEKIEVIK